MLATKQIHGELYPELVGDQISRTPPDTKINDWIQESLIYTAQRESFEKDNPLVLTLFRYLGIRHKVMHPEVQFDSYKISSQLMAKLRKAICEKAVEYFTLSKEEDPHSRLEGYPILQNNLEVKPSHQQKPTSEPAKIKSQPRQTVSSANTNVRPTVKKQMPSSKLKVN